MPQFPPAPTRTDWGPLRTPASCGWFSPSASVPGSPKALMRPRPDVTLQLQAALADPWLPCPCPPPEMGLGGNLVSNTWPPPFQGSRRLRPELPASYRDFNEPALVFICVPACVARGCGTGPRRGWGSAGTAGTAGFLSSAQCLTLTRWPGFHPVPGPPVFSDVSEAQGDHRGTGALRPSRRVNRFPRMFEIPPEGEHRSGQSHRNLMSTKPQKHGPGRKPFPAPRPRGAAVLPEACGKGLPAWLPSRGRSGPTLPLGLSCY